MYQPKDITSQLSEYIKKNLAKGYNLDTLRFSLISQGYSRITVENAIERANKELAIKIPPVKEKPRIIYKLINEQNQPIKISEIKPRRGFFKRIFG